MITAVEPRFIHDNASLMLDKQCNVQYERAKIDRKAVRSSVEEPTARTVIDFLEEGMDGNGIVTSVLGLQS